MLLPKRTKFRRVHRGRLKGTSTANTVAFGEFGIQALEPVWLTSRQIEATRRSITRSVRRTGKIWIRVFPDKPITARAAESRMGSGKGTPEYWVAVIKPGAVLFEINGLERTIAHKVLKLASYKLPIKTKIIDRVAA
jgi:large subunit ribosomal protein L16|tara:strand:+ start:18050 stop:18460 length:411 start_codon:yes stop_codon:yes gene_type:complete